jgi:hypothetical protein
MSKTQPSNDLQHGPNLHLNKSLNSQGFRLADASILTPSHILSRCHEFIRYTSTSKQPRRPHITPHIPLSSNDTSQPRYRLPAQPRNPRFHVPSIAPTNQVQYALPNGCTWFARIWGNFAGKSLDLSWGGLGVEVQANANRVLGRSGRLGEGTKRCGVAWLRTWGRGLPGGEVSLL